MEFLRFCKVGLRGVDPSVECHPRLQRCPCIILVLVGAAPGSTDLRNSLSTCSVAE